MFQVCSSPCDPVEAKIGWPAPRSPSTCWPRRAALTGGHPRASAKEARRSARASWPRRVGGDLGAGNSKHWGGPPGAQGAHHASTRACELTLTWGVRWRRALLGVCRRGTPPGWRVLTRPSPSGVRADVWDVRPQPPFGGCWAWRGRPVRWTTENGNGMCPSAPVRGCALNYALVRPGNAEIMGPPLELLDPDISAGRDPTVQHQVCDYHEQPGL